MREKQGLAGSATWWKAWDVGEAWLTGGRNGMGITIAHTTVLPSDCQQLPSLVFKQQVSNCLKWWLQHLILNGSSPHAACFPTKTCVHYFLTAYALHVCFFIWIQAHTCYSVSTYKLYLSLISVAMITYPQSTREERGLKFSFQSQVTVHHWVEVKSGTPNS